MTPETIALINQMSGTLTGAAADIWASALMQARMQAWINVGVVAMFALMFSIGLYLIIYFSKKVVKGTEENPDYVLEGDFKQAMWGCWVFCMIIYITIVLSEIGNIITMFTNPTFWAITHLIGGSN